MKAHLLVFDPTQVDRVTVRDAVDRINTIENWTLFFGNTMCLASMATARSLSKQIRAAMPGVRFVITTIDPEQKGGWLPKSIWHSMNEPMALNEPAPLVQNSDA